ncbi:MAG: hypothetical protein AAF206_00210 [Bacteroidota bacterium]
MKIDLQPHIEQVRQDFTWQRFLLAESPYDKLIPRPEALLAWPYRVMETLTPMIAEDAALGREFDAAMIQTMSEPQGLRLAAYYAFQWDRFAKGEVRGQSFTADFVSVFNRKLQQHREALTDIPQRDASGFSYPDGQFGEVCALVRRLRGVDLFAEMALPADVRTDIVLPGRKKTGSSAEDAAPGEGGTPSANAQRESLPLSIVEVKLDPLAASTAPPCLFLSMDEYGTETGLLYGDQLSLSFPFGYDFVYGPLSNLHKHPFLIDPKQHAELRPHLLYEVKHSSWPQHRNEAREALREKDRLSGMFLQRDDDFEFSFRMIDEARHFLIFWDENRCLQILSRKVDIHFQPELNNVFSTYQQRFHAWLHATD